jgi:cell division protein ZapA (FtsZ GTPase activity inhibitor)
MPLLNYTEPMLFPDAVEAAAVLLSLCLVKLRDEAAHREDEDSATLTAAHFFIDLLEDTLKESEALANTLETRLNDFRQRQN